MEKYKCSRCGKEFEADSFKSDGQFSCPFCFFGVGKLVANEKFRVNYGSNCCFCTQDLLSLKEALLTEEGILEADPSQQTFIEVYDDKEGWVAV